jgi:hypothetical protein
VGVMAGVTVEGGDHRVDRRRVCWWTSGVDAMAGA